MNELAGDLKYWEEQLHQLKESKFKKYQQQPVEMPQEQQEQMTGTVIEVAQEEVAQEEETSTIIPTIQLQSIQSQQSSCMYADVGQPIGLTTTHSTVQGGASVIYIDGLVGQQPTYINAIPQHVYPGSVHSPQSAFHSIGHGYGHANRGAHHSGQFQNAEGSIQVFTSGDITSPSYVAYQ